VPRAKPSSPVLNRSHPLAKGLRSAWLMEEGGGTNLRDHVGQNYGTLTGSPSWINAEYGSALQFFDTGEYVDVPNNPYSIAELQAHGGTWAAWFKVPSVGTSNGDEGIVGGAGAGTHSEYSAGGLYLQQGAGGAVPKAAIHDGSYQYLAAAEADWFVAGQWTSVVFTVDVGGALTLYAHGRSVDTGTATMGSLAFEPAVFYLGREPNGNDLVGSIAYASFSHGAWTANQVRQFHADPFAMFRPRRSPARFFVPSVAAEGNLLQRSGMDGLSRRLRFTGGIDG